MENNKSWGDTIADHTTYIRRVALKYTCDPERSKDLAQDVAILALIHADKFDGVYLKGWLATLTHNLFVTQYHRGKKFGYMVEANDSIYDARLFNHSSENYAVFDLTQSDLRTAIQQANPVYQDAALLRLEGLKYEEIADELGIPIGTVRSRLKRVRELLPDRSHF
ncbi:RNA polymerase sigma factor [Spirosoma sp.]|uniref:RNA polymerase sigma factor n=1 Tax=Spirosoma sp. TaxID=1899569 RepID=UPI003B3BCE85